MKKIIKVFLVIIVLNVLLNLTAFAEDIEWRQSKLLPENVKYSIGYGHQERGDYLSSALLSITNEGYSSIGIYAFPIAHTQPLHYRHPSHHVDVKKNTLLASFGDDTSIQVNSCHHQAIRRLAPGLIAGGVASDGIVEEIELPDYPFLVGVQWHPEYLWETDPCARNLFQAFVDACKSKCL